MELEQTSWWAEGDFRSRQKIAQHRMRTEEQTPAVGAYSKELLEMEQRELLGLPTRRNPMTPTSPRSSTPSPSTTTPTTPAGAFVYDPAE